MIFCCFSGKYSPGSVRLQGRPRPETLSQNCTGTNEEWGGLEVGEKALQAPSHGRSSPGGSSFLGRAGTWKGARLGSASVVRCHVSAQAQNSTLGAAFCEWRQDPGLCTSSHDHVQVWYFTQQRVCASLGWQSGGKQLCCDFFKWWRRQ